MLVAVPVTPVGDPVDNRRLGEAALPAGVGPVELETRRVARGEPGLGRVVAGAAVVGQIGGQHRRRSR